MQLHERLHERIENGNHTQFKNTRTGKIDAERWFSTCDEKLIRDAILLLMETEVGFNINIKAPAGNGRDAELSLMRFGYGIGPYGPPDTWQIKCYYLSKDTNSIDDLPDPMLLEESYKNPEEAINRFLSIRKEREIGHDMGDFTVSGCPNWREIDV